jgi:AAA ATPase domain
MSASPTLERSAADSSTDQRSADGRRNPFPGPRPYERDDAPDFLGRTREIRELRALIGGRGVVVVVGPSGCGKSSLLRAGVRPALEAGEYEVLPIARVGEAARERGEQPGDGSIFERNIASYVLSAAVEGDASGRETREVASAPERSNTTQPLLARLAQRPRRQAEDGAPMPRVLIIDQFEELFTTHLDAWRDRPGILRTLLAANDGAIDTRMVLVIRAEYLSAFAALLARLGEGTSAQSRSVAYYHVERLTQDAARHVMATLFTRDFPRFPVAGAAELAKKMSREFVRLPDGKREEAEGEFVEPLYLQIVCRSLWDKLASGALAADDQSIVVNADLEGELRGFVLQQIVGVAKETGTGVSKILKWLSEVLITPAGTRGSVIREAQQSGGMPNAVVEALERRHLLRGEERAAGQWYELSHDQLVSAVRRLRRDERARHERRTERIIRGVLFTIVAVAMARGLWVGRASQADSTATARSAARRAAEVVDSQPELATAVIQEALAMGGDSETDSIARWIAARTLTSRVVHVLSRRPLVASAASPESLVAVGMEDGRVMVLNVLHVTGAALTGAASTGAAGAASANATRRTNPASLRAFGADVRGVVPGWKGGAVGLAFAREGRRLAVAGTQGRVALIAGPEWRPDGEVTIPDEVSAVGVTASGNEAAIGTPGGGLRRLPRRARAAPRRVSLSPAFASCADVFGYREPEEGAGRRLAALLEGIDPRTRPRRITDLAFAPEGDLLAVEANGAVQVWALGGAIVEHAWLPGLVRGRDLARHPSRMAVSPDGRTIVVTAGDSVHLLRREGGALTPSGTLACATLPGQRATALAFSPDSSTLLVASDAGVVTAWDVRSGACTWNASAARSRIVGIVALPSGGRFVTVADNQEVRLWVPPPTQQRVEAEVTTWLTQAMRR